MGARCPLCNSTDLPTNKPHHMAWYIAPTEAVAVEVYMCCRNCRDYTQIWAASRNGSRLYLCGDVGDIPPRTLDDDAICINAAVSSYMFHDNEANKGPH